METIKALNRSKSVEILETHKKSGKLHFNQIVKDIDANTSTASRALNDLLESHLVNRIEEGSKRTDKVYYEITEKGVDVLNVIYDLIKIDEKYSKK